MGLCWATVATSAGKIPPAGGVKAYAAESVSQWGFHRRGTTRFGHGEGEWAWSRLMAWGVWEVGWPGFRLVCKETLPELIVEAYLQGKMVVPDIGIDALVWTWAGEVVGCTGMHLIWRSQLKPRIPNWISAGDLQRFSLCVCVFG